MPEIGQEAEAQARYRQIAARAYALREQEGCPHGRDIGHWLKAEAEITGAGKGPEDVTASEPSRGTKPEKAAA